MTVTTAAVKLIREFLQRSTIPHPAIYLGQVSDQPGSPRYLYPLVFPRSRYLWVTTRVSGFPFALPIFYPRGTRRAMREGILDVAERGLVLKDAGGTVVLPKG